MPIFPFAFFRKTWTSYIIFIAKTLLDTKEQLNPSQLLRNRFFLKIVTFAIPIGLLSLTMNIIAFLIKDKYMRDIPVDLLVFAAFIFVSLNRRIKINVKKILIILLTIVFSLTKIFLSGNLVSGTTLLFSITVFSPLLFEKKICYLLLAVNSLLAFLSSILLSVGDQVLTLEVVYEHLINRWTSSAMNFTVLNLIGLHIISYLISDFDQILAKKKRIYLKLRQEVEKKTTSEKLLQETMIHYRSLFYLSPLPMVIYDKNSLKVLRVNDSAIKSYGYSEKEFVALEANTILKWTREQFFDNLIEGHANAVYKHYCKDGTSILVDVKSSDITLDDLQARLAIIRDITAETNYLNTIEAQNNNMRKIAHMQSHVVRSPLSRILALVELLQAGSNNKEEHQQLLNFLLTSSKELDVLVTDIIKKTELGVFDQYPKGFRSGNPTR